IATDSGEMNRFGRVSRVSAFTCWSSLIARRLSAWIRLCSWGVSARGNAVIRGGGPTGSDEQPPAKTPKAIAARQKRFMTASFVHTIPPGLSRSSLSHVHHRRRMLYVVGARAPSTLTRRLPHACRRCRPRPPDPPNRRLGIAGHPPRELHARPRRHHREPARGRFHRDQD